MPRKFIERWMGRPTNIPEMPEFFYSFLVGTTEEQAAELWDWFQESSHPILHITSLIGTTHPTLFDREEDDEP